MLTAANTTTGHAAHALGVIQGETQAHHFLNRLADETADAHTLAERVSTLEGPALLGFCGALVKALVRGVRP